MAEPKYTWNHRVIIHPHERETWMGIHEVHYEDGKPRAYTISAIGIIAEESDEGGAHQSMKITLERMLRALDKPWLHEKDFEEAITNKRSSSPDEKPIFIYTDD